MSLNALNPFSSSSETLNRTDKQEIKALSLKWNRKQQFSREDVKKYLEIQQGVLQQALKEGRITTVQFHQVRDLRITWKTQMISFTVPGTDQKVSYAFEDIPCVKARDALNALIDRANADNIFVEKYSHVCAHKGKGNPHGSEPLQRSSSLTKKLPSSFRQTKIVTLPKLLASAPEDTAKRQAIVKRVAHADLIVRQMPQRLQEKINEKEQLLKSVNASDSSNSAQIGRLRGEIQQLKALKDKFASVDSYALTVALSKLPVGPFSSDALKKAVDEAQTQVKSDLETKGKGKFRNTKLNQKDHAYIQGVAGLMHQSRGEYFNYCERHKMRPEKECLEDLISHEAVRVGDGDNYNKDAIKKSFLLASMTPELQDEVAKMFNGINESAKNAKDFPADAETYSGKDETAIKTAIAKRWDELDMAQYRAPKVAPSSLPEAIVNAASQVTNKNGLSVATGVVATAAVADRFLFNGALSQALPSAVATGARAVVNNPIAAIGTVGIAAMDMMNMMNHATTLYKHRGMVYELSGSVALTLVAASFGLGMPIQKIFDYALANPHYATAAVATVFEGLKHIKDYVYPVGGSSAIQKPNRKLNYSRLFRAGAAATAVAYGVMQLYNSCQGVSDGSLGSMACSAPGVAADFAWNHFVLALIGANILKSQVARLPKMAQKVASSGINIFKRIASAASSFNFIGRVSSIFGKSQQ